MDKNLCINENYIYNWYAFHFGCDYVENVKELPDFNGKMFEDCYIMFADFCNFSKFISVSDSIAKAEQFISEYYEKGRDIIHRYNGMLDKILGDGFLVIWGLHTRVKDISDIYKCILELNSLGESISSEWQKNVDIVIKEKGMKFGLSKGKVFTVRRSEFYPGISVFGNAINLAARLESIAKRGEIVCSNSAFEDIRKFYLINKDKMQISDNIEEIECFSSEIKGIGEVIYYKLDVEMFSVIKEFSKNF